MRRLVPLLVLALATVGCSASSGGAPSDGPGTSSGTSVEPGVSPSGPDASSFRPVTPAPGPSGSGSVTLPPSIVDPIVADAAARLGVPASDVVVVTAVAKTWSDGGLGCPIPGMVYPQMLTDGYQVVVRVGLQTLDYRGSGSQFRICPASG